MKANSPRNESSTTEQHDGTLHDHSSLDESLDLDELDAPDADDSGDDAWWEDAFIPDDDEYDPLPEYHDFWDEVDADD